ncbi:hypothetical protein [Phycicoccus sonneratiae]|uniref:Uncharacterized protein n=1 Tax=Phycicoccus sonneratiae TaxID=2807628 RepID=A0ABS2CFW1_9MICO|nr:hypothetical protein [Phycicoccus sonneraticus]MBM6398768.1 hypothetical protein [Phycicoccus sonneraticus]
MLAVGVTAAVAGLVAPAAAHAAPAAAEATRTTRVVDQVRFSGAQVVAEAGRDRGQARADAAKRDFLASQARSGVLWDGTEVASATLGRDTDVAYSTNIDLTQVRTALVEQADGEQSSEIQAVGEPKAASTSSAQGFRAGSDSLKNVAGQVNGSYSGGALTVQVSGDKLTSAWERYRVKESKTDRNIYYYGHWATAVGKVVSGGNDHHPGTIDIRSRPKVGHRGDFLQMRNYWPKESGTNCDDYNVSIGILGFSAGLPLGNCEGFTPDPNASDILMKNVWSDGACRDSRSEYADLGMAVDVRTSASTALLSDYSYARFEEAICDQDSGDDIRVIYADPGWS